MIYTKNNIVRASDCGFTTDLSLPGAFHAVEDAYCEFLGKLGADGVYVLKTYGATWMYTKHKMQIFKTLPWNSRYNSRCFISRISKLIYVTDIAFFDEADELALYSQIETCLIDVNSQQIKPLADIGFENNETHPPLIQGSFSRLITKNDVTEICRTKVNNCNIDYNGHTNNTEYIRFLLDSYDMDILRDRSIKSIEINYLNQSRLNDELVVLRTSADGRDRFDIRRDDTTIIKGEIVF